MTLHYTVQTVDPDGKPAAITFSVSTQEGVDICERMQKAPQAPRIATPRALPKLVPGAFCPIDP